MTTKHCPACKTGTLQAITKQREFFPYGRLVEVETSHFQCDACGAEVTTNTQRIANQKSLTARKPQYAGLLLGEEIFAMRRFYGMTQQQASILFGKGKIAFSRYENETSYPDDSLTKLLRIAIEDPRVVAKLAQDEGVDLPILAKRIEAMKPLKATWDMTAAVQHNRLIFHAIDLINEEIQPSTEAIEKWLKLTKSSVLKNPGALASSANSAIFREEEFA